MKGAEHRCLNVSNVVTLEIEEALDGWGGASEAKI